MKSLSEKELELMEILWKIDKGFLKQIVDQYKAPKPAYTTISTVLKRMIEKNHIGFKMYGRDKEYFPILKKTSYFSSIVNNTINQFFKESPTQFASFFTSNKSLTLAQLEELKSMVNEEIDKKKKQSHDT